MKKQWVGVLIALVLATGAVGPLPSSHAQAVVNWSQLVTGPSTVVTIPAGQQVNFDVAEGHALDLIVYGTFAVPDGANARLNIHRNLIIDGGRTIRGPTLQQFTIEWPSVNEATFVGGGDHLQALTTDPGLWMFRGAQWQLNGDPKRSWMRMTSSIAAGVFQITLPEDPVGWRVGDEVLITPTEPVSVQYHWTHHDVHTISAISGRTITFTSAVQYPHPIATINGRVYGAEVANLSRNVLLTGRPRARPHFYAHGLTLPLTISDITIRYFGPRNASNVGHAGRYAFHLHKNASATYNSVITGVVVRDSGNMGFVAHASHGIRFVNTVAHSVVMAMRTGSEGAYWWDPRPSTYDTSNESNDIVYDGAGASHVIRIPGISSTFQRTGGFITSEGFRNQMLNIWASGVQAQPPDTGCVDCAGIVWPEGSTALGRGIWDLFVGVFHNNLKGAFAWTNDTNAPDLPHDIRDVVTYRNTRYGIDVGAYANSYVWQRPVSAENGTYAVLMHSQSFHPNYPLFTYQDGFFDASGGVHAFATANHQLTPAPVVLLRNTFRGYTRSAIGFLTTSGNREWYIVDNNNWSGGNPFWGANTIRSDSLVQVRNDAVYGNTDLRRYDQQGTYVPAWNMRRSP